jgi:hypothetical protein
MEPLNDRQKDLFEDLWWDLRRLYQRDIAMADNGIPFRMRMEQFISDYAASEGKPHA